MCVSTNDNDDSDGDDGGEEVKKKAHKKFRYWGAGEVDRGGKRNLRVEKKIGKTVEKKKREQ